MTPQPQAKTTPSQFNNDEWSANAQFHEYLSVVNPLMPKINVNAFDASIHQSGKTRVIPLDLSTQLKTNYPATTPNLMASFLRICLGESLITTTAASSEMFYVIRGAGSSETEWGTTSWKEGDLFVIPTTGDAVHTASEDSAIYWVSDSPVMKYLGVKPTEKQFKPVLFTNEQIQEKLMAEYHSEDALSRNRIGILLSNPACPLTKTLTHTLWSLYNILPTGVTQLPHRHNSVALDFCVTAGENTYTLIGQEIDENGHIINPIKAMWTPGSMFVTPPGWWHSHHNESGENAIVLPIQDAGLQTYMQTLDIQFVKEQK
jgi:gentisate 1,2-dioxygenase